MVPTPTLVPTPTPTATVTPSPTPPVTPTVDPALAELDVVSAAIATLMADNGLTVIPNPVTVNEPPCTKGTQDMTRFPDTASAVGTPDKSSDPSGVAYTSGVGTSGDKDGYLLFAHDAKADNRQSTIVSYVRFVRSIWCYAAESDGYVRQYDEAGNETPRPPRPTPTPTPTPPPPPTLTPEEAEGEALERFLETPEGELEAVSAAVADLMSQVDLASIPNPVTAGTLPCPIGTQDMSAFPDATSGVGTNDKLRDPFGRSYTQGVDPLGDKDGYLLIGHDVFADDQQILLQSYVGFTRSAWCYSADGDGTVHQHEPGKLQILGGVDELLAAFSDGDGSARLVLLLSPESVAARERAGWVQRQVLDPNPGIALEVYVVWGSTSGGVDPFAWPIFGLTPDDRVTEYWDDQQLSGRWFAVNFGSNVRQPDRPFDDALAYDAYYLFGPDARWGGEPPDLLSTEVDYSILSRFTLSSALEKLFPGME